MRPILAACFALFVAGCSLVWDMGPYERTADAGAASRADASSANGSSGTSAVTDAAPDVAAPATCHDEVEPNDDRRQAIEIPSGKTCATLSDAFDDDYWRATGTAQIAVTVTIQDGMQFLVMTDGAGFTVHDAPGATNLVLPPGSHVIWVQSKDATFGDYSFER